MDMTNLKWWLYNVRTARDTEAVDDPKVVSGEAWHEFCDELRATGDLILREDVPNNPLDRASGYRHVLALLRTAIDEAMTTPLLQHPYLSHPTRTDVYKWGLDCPDSAYRGTTIDGASTYILRGRPGSMPYMSFQVNAGMANIGNLRKDQMVLEPDGSFVVTVGPDEVPGNWLRTTPECDAIIMREFFWDWDNDVSGDTEIELVTRAGRLLKDESNDPTPGLVGAQLREIQTFVKANMDFWIDLEAGGLAAMPNGFPPATAKPESGGAHENLNAFGQYTLAPDEALIIDCEPVEAQYWSVHLGTFWWESLDYGNRHTSLNGFQATLDADGRVRAVVSPVDPGVPNWLDTCGHAAGPMLFRWVVAEEGPEVTCTVVKISEVRDHLPADTATVTPEERQATIDRRRKHVIRRYNQNPTLPTA
jgi:hypothetical protein